MNHEIIEVEGRQHPCEAVLWGAFGGYAFNNRFCAVPTRTKIGDGWYCKDHEATGLASQGRKDD